MERLLVNSNDWEGVDLPSPSTVRSKKPKGHLSRALPGTSRPSVLNPGCGSFTGFLKCQGGRNRLLGCKCLDGQGTSDIGPTCKNDALKTKMYAGEMKGGKSVIMLDWLNYYKNLAWDKSARSKIMIIEAEMKNREQGRDRELFLIKNKQWKYI